MLTNTLLGYFLPASLIVRFVIPIVGDAIIPAARIFRRPKSTLPRSQGGRPNRSNFGPTVLDKNGRTLLQSRVTVVTRSNETILPTTDQPDSDQDK
ncbi:MAG: hypothetical protein KDB88_02380 [Flavobacteriales bacterium]|nr:hypothetical protein [Flavobacteriales bacterium]